MRSVVCLIAAAMLVAGTAQANSQGSNGSGQVVTHHTVTTESHGSSGSYGWTPIRNGIERRQDRRADRQYRREMRQASRGSHGSTASGSSHGSSTYIVEGVGWDDAATAQACANCATSETESAAVAAPQ